MRNAYAGQPDFDLPQQMALDHPDMIQVTASEHSSSAFEILINVIPEWFFWVSFVVGSVTVIILIIRFTPMGKYVNALLEVWSKLLKGK